MKLKTVQVIGLNTDQKAAQVSSDIREDSTFLAVLQLTSDDAFTKGRQALSELEDFFFEFEGTQAEKLNATFKEASQKFEGLEYDLALAVVAGKVLYLVGQGQVEVYLRREGKLSSLLSVGAPSQLVSGFISTGDKLLFGTKTLIDFLDEDLEKVLKLPIETFEEELEGKIGTSGSENLGLAALVVEAEETEEAISALPVADTAAAESREPVFDKQAVFSKAADLFGKARMYFPKSGRSRLVLAVILILIIVSGIGFKYKASRDKENNLAFSQSYQQAKDSFEAAKGLASLNPADAKLKLDSARDTIVKALSIKPKDAEALNLKKQIEDEGPAILQQSSVSDFPVFLDLDLVKKNFRAQKLSLSGSKILLLDPDVKTLVEVDLTKKSNQILAGSEQLGEALSASINGSLAFVFSKDKGILRVDTANSKVSSVAKADTEWGSIADIYGFGGNIYALDSGKNMIWKYLPAAAGYSDKREYLTKGTTVDLASVVRMQIESSVYVLKDGGEISRFTKGDKDNFSYSGLPASTQGGPSGVKDPKSIFVSSDTDNLYVLDSGNSRLLILTKTGSYKGQITGGKFATASDLAVDEVGKKVYLLEGSKIYSVDLK